MQSHEAREFADWLLTIGEGRSTAANQNRGTDGIGSDNTAGTRVAIPLTYLLTRNSRNLDGLIRHVFGDFSGDIQSCAILAPWNEEVTKINELVLQALPGRAKSYLSADSVTEENLIPLYPLEFLNSIRPSGFPPHELLLKADCMIVLLRNISPSNGLCNGTRLKVIELGQHILGCTIAMPNSSFNGNAVLIPRIALHSTEGELPFTIQRIQFPVQLAYAMTINKAQGQSLSRVGVYLPRPVFTHGQLYVALSRCRSGDGLKILLGPDAAVSVPDSTNNVVFHEIFRPQ